MSLGSSGRAAGRDAAGEPVVDLREIGVAVPRRARPLLRGVDLQVRPGEDVLVLGPSGSGKSTLLDVITGVVPHTVTASLTGRGSVAGLDLGSPVTARAAHLGHLGQDPFAAVCLPRVDEEVALPLENQAVDPVLIGPRVHAALDVVGAGHLHHRSTASLSGGEAQRVALAAALVTGPELLLLDEPTAMLDPAGVASVRAAVAAATTRSGPVRAGTRAASAVILVEHRLDEWAGERGLQGLPSRSVVLDVDGTVVADGPTRAALVDGARELLAGGCWLPLEAEAAAVGAWADGAVAAAARLGMRAARGRVPGGWPARGDAHGARPVLVARGLCVGHGARRGGRGWRTRDPDVTPVLRGLDLAVRPGEVVAVLGANGAGKSTLLLTLAGLLTPVAGTVDGARPGMVFQNPEHQLVAHTVRSEVAHGLVGRPGAPVARVVDERLAQHRLTHVADQNPYRLSGGEKRRLSLAAMLAHERPVLLADEPTFGLDRRDTVATVDAMREVARRGTAVVLASHDLRSVVALANRVVLLGGGRVLRDGPTVPVLRDRAALRAAGLRLPTLVAWLLEHRDDDASRLLRAMDEEAAGLWATAVPHSAEEHGVPVPVVAR